MKKLIYLFILVCLGINSYGQKAISARVNADLQKNGSFEKVEIFNKLQATGLNGTENILRKSTLLNIDKSKIQFLLLSNPHNISLRIPTDSSFIDLDLFQSQIFTPDFFIETATKKDQSVMPPGLHFWGIIHGDNQSICAISIFENEIMGLISTPALGNINLGRLSNNENDVHILFNEKDLLISPEIDCQTEENSNTYSPQQLTAPSHLNTNCIRLYWEVNYDIFLDKGGITNTTNYIVGLFNESALLYANDNIPVELSSLFIWDTISPYTATITITQLNLFQSTRNSFAGDLGHLLGYEGSGGVAASVSGLCSSNLDYSMCYSGIHSTYQNVPVFSWSVEVVTHEQGHLLGSRHTHACVWNGNNTAIDCCGPLSGRPYEGNCSGAPFPANGGTIMSYCHLTSAGIDFTLGFGPQPTAVILNNYNNASCLSPCVGGTFCGSASGLMVSGISTTTVTLTWNAFVTAVSYYVQYREVGSSTWILDSTSVNSYNASNLNPGATYEWQVQTVCSGGTSIWSNISSFITAPLVCNSPGGIIISNLSAITADFTWTPATAAIGYNVQYRLTGSSTWISVSTTSNSLHISGLQPNSNYEIQIQTICSGGGTSAFSSSVNFTTLEAGAPVTVTLQPDAQCGKDALIGSNVPWGYYITNFGDFPEFNAMSWTAGGERSYHKSLIEFDLSFIPPGSAVQSAYLSLYWNPSSGNPGHSTLSGSNEARLSKITSPWGEMLVTWVTRPGITTDHEVILPASTSSSQNYLNIDITAMAQDFVNDPQMNYGMMLQETDSIPYRSLIFASSDHSDPSLHPKLEITYLPNISECIHYQFSNCEGIDAIIGNATAPGYDTSNFGDHAEFDAMAWTYGGAPTHLRSLIYWDVSEIPANAIVHNATLKLYWNPNSGNPGHSSQSGPNDGRLEFITSPWGEHSVTWNTQPSTDTSKYVLLPPSSNTQQDYSVNLTSITQEWVQNPSANNGLLFRLLNESHFRSLIFASSDFPDPAKHPRLDICYSIPTGISTINNQTDVIVYQDADFSKLNILFRDGNIHDYRFLLYSLDGKLVGEYSGKNNQFSIQKKNIASGLYLYKLISGDKTLSGKSIFR